MKNLILFLLLTLSIPLMVLLNLSMGSVGMDDQLWETVVMNIRLPQTLTAMACGAGLSVAGLQMQTIFHNPLAGPSVLGISSAASLGVAFVVLLSGAIGGSAMLRFGLVGNTALTASAIAGAMCVMMMIVWLSHRVEGNVTLLIAGVLIGYIATAIIGVMKAFSSEEDIRAFVVWGLGSFSRVSGGQVGVFVTLMLVLLPMSMLLAKPLNILLIGDRYATNLGLNIRRSRMCIIASAGILTAVVTAYCGPIMFLGLAVPHITKGIFRVADHRVLLPATMLCGMTLALVCLCLSRLPYFNGSLPINSVTALIGSPIALYVLLKKKRQ